VAVGGGGPNNSSKCLTEVPRLSILNQVLDLLRTTQEALQS